MNDDLRMWVDMALILVFPATLLTGMFMGPRGLPCHWHTGCAFILTLLVLLHLMVNERGLLRVIKRFREVLYGRDGDATMVDDAEEGADD